MPWMVLPANTTAIASPHCSASSSIMGWLLALLPALGGGVVGLAGIDPARALGRFLALPERRAGLEEVHDELAGGEGLAAMRAGHCHEHDLLARFETAEA